MSWFIGAIVVISLAGIVTDYLSKKQKIHLKYVDKQIELEKLKHENYLIETEKMKLELEKMQLEAPIYDGEKKER